MDYDVEPKLIRHLNNTSRGFDLHDFCECVPMNLLLLLRVYLTRLFKLTKSVAFSI
jgi:hypothetical protein